jgi:hypothetical protein
MSDDVETAVSALPSDIELGGWIESYARKRGYVGFDNDKLYSMVSYDGQAMALSDYSEDVKADLRDVIFTYLPNKKSNIEKIRKHRYYNENCYPITTGDEPIVVSPIYKNDGGYKEVENCALYYYYFKESDLEGVDAVQFIKDLPKFRAVDFHDCVLSYPGMSDDVLKKQVGYTLIYWGDEPTEGCHGSYHFPMGYKIGFMLRNEGKAVHQGELYCDGRLNGEVNSWGHLASAKLGPTDARMAWLGYNDKNYLCCESGTDRDFNDIVIEVEGGIEPIGDIPDVEFKSYCYCFEDTRDGDYDLNDVVIRARRIGVTKVEYSVVACGARDELYIQNIFGTRINPDKEVHEMLGWSRDFINTVKGGIVKNWVTDTIVVEREFSFLDNTRMPYILNKTKNYAVAVSSAGEDPHGIMVPYEFRYPLEMVCIKDAYPLFNNWGINKVLDTDWYRWPEEELVW